MSPRSTRRQFLGAGAALVPPLVAGCSQLPDVGSSDATATTHPDEGTDSYGIKLDSRISAPATVELKTTKPFEDDPIWREEVTIESGIQTYNSVLTAEHGEQAFTATLLDVDDGEELEQIRSDGFWITPGSEDAPDARRFPVRVQKVRRDGDSHYVIDVVSRHL